MATPTSGSGSASPHHANQEGLSTLVAGRKSSALPSRERVSAAIAMVRAQQGTPTNVTPKRFSRIKGLDQLRNFKKTTRKSSTDENQSGNGNVLGTPKWNSPGPSQSVATAAIAAVTATAAAAAAATKETSSPKAEGDAGGGNGLPNQPSMQDPRDDVEGSHIGIGNGNATSDANSNGNDNGINDEDDMITLMREQDGNSDDDGEVVATEPAPEDYVIPGAPSFTQSAPAAAAALTSTLSEEDPIMRMRGPSFDSSDEDDIEGSNSDVDVDPSTLAGIAAYIDAVTAGSSPAKHDDEDDDDDEDSIPSDIPDETEAGVLNFLDRLEQKRVAKDAPTTPHGTPQPTFSEDDVIPIYEKLQQTNQQDEVTHDPPGTHHVRETTTQKNDPPTPTSAIITESASSQDLVRADSQDDQDVNVKDEAGGDAPIIAAAAQAAAPAAVGAVTGAAVVASSNSASDGDCPPFDDMDDAIITQRTTEDPEVTSAGTDAHSDAAEDNTDDNNSTSEDSEPEPDIDTEDEASFPEEQAPMDLTPRNPARIIRPPPVPEVNAANQVKSSRAPSNGISTAPSVCTTAFPSFGEEESIDAVDSIIVIHESYSDYGEGQAPVDHKLNVITEDNGRGDSTAHEGDAHNDKYVSVHSVHDVHDDAVDDDRYQILSMQTSTQEEDVNEGDEQEPIDAHLAEAAVAAGVAVAVVGAAAAATPMVTGDVRDDEANVSGSAQDQSEELDVEDQQLTLSMEPSGDYDTADDDDDDDRNFLDELLDNEQVHSMPSSACSEELIAQPSSSYARAPTNSYADQLQSTASELDTFISAAAVPSTVSDASEEEEEEEEEEKKDESNQQATDGSGDARGFDSSVLGDGNMTTSYKDEAPPLLQLDSVVESVTNDQDQKDDDDAGPVDDAAQELLRKNLPPSPNKQRQPKNVGSAFHTEIMLDEEEECVEVLGNEMNEPGGQRLVSPKYDEQQNNPSANMPMDLLSGWHDPAQHGQQVDPQGLSPREDDRRRLSVDPSYQDDDTDADTDTDADANGADTDSYADEDADDDDDQQGMGFANSSEQEEDDDEFNETASDVDERNQRRYNDQDGVNRMASADETVQGFRAKPSLLSAKSSTTSASDHLRSRGCDLSGHTTASGKISNTQNNNGHSAAAQLSTQFCNPRCNKDDATDDEGFDIDGQLIEAFLGESKSMDEGDEEDKRMVISPRSQAIVAAAVAGAGAVAASFSIDQNIAPSQSRQSHRDGQRQHDEATMFTESPTKSAGQEESDVFFSQFSSLEVEGGDKAKNDANASAGEQNGRESKAPATSAPRSIVDAAKGADGGTHLDPPATANLAKPENLTSLKRLAIYFSQLKAPENGTKEDKKKIRRFQKLIAGVMNGEKPTIIEAAQIRQAAQRADVSLTIVDRFLEFADDEQPQIVEAPSTKDSMDLATSNLSQIENIDEDEAIAGFLNRYEALKAGGHFQHGLDASSNTHGHATASGASATHSNSNSYNNSHTTRNVNNHGSSTYCGDAGSVTTSATHEDIEVDAQMGFVELKNEPQYEEEWWLEANGDNTSRQQRLIQLSDSDDERDDNAMPKATVKSSSVEDTEKTASSDNGDDDVNGNSDNSENVEVLLNSDNHKGHHLTNPVSSPSRRLGSSTIGGQRHVSSPRGGGGRRGGFSPPSSPNRRGADWKDRALIESASYAYDHKHREEPRIWARKNSMSVYGTAWEKHKRWVQGHTHASRNPKPIDGVAAAGHISRFSFNRGLLPVTRPWQLSYKERTKQHAGYFNIDVYSIYDTSAALHDDADDDEEDMDYLPWESRNVKQRFLHEKSISFSRNWYGSNRWMRGNDRVKQPVCKPKSMEMPIENIPHPGDWTEEWYTTWKSPGERDAIRSVQSRDSASRTYEDTATYTHTHEHTRCDEDTWYTNDDRTYGTATRAGDDTVFDKSAASSTREYNSTFEHADSSVLDGERDYNDDDDDDDESWEEAPECGVIINVKQKIGERISRVHPNFTSSLRRSRWRKKYFPQGTFPYRT